MEMDKTIITNPIIWADVPDVDVIRVENSYYMVSTSMHSMPGCPIMKSDDLLHWEIVNYVYETLEENEAHNLINKKNIYGQGSWAASLRYHNEMYYVCFSSNDTNRFYIYQTRDIETGPWQRSTIEGLYHDPGLLFDDGRVFVIYGNGDIRITELTEDVSSIKADGIHQLLFSTKREGIMLRAEGCHAYRINGYYYLLFIEWPSVENQRRRQVCYRSKKLLGPYERKIIFDDDMSYHNKGIAQGGIFDTPQGNWYTMLFQDHDAVGRIPYVLPISWENGWPLVGVNGKALERFEVDLPASPKKPLVISDDFTYTENKLKLHWQWNHNPDNERWSVTTRPGYLRLETCHITDTVMYARNTLTQRTEGPKCRGSSFIDLSQMKAGDHAGLIALQSTFGTVGIKVAEDRQKYVVMCVNRGDGGEEIVEEKLIQGNSIYLKIAFNFEESIDVATFYYSTNGQEWISIGKELNMKYTLDHFMGYRIGLFNYAARQIGGYVDFKYFHYEKKSKI